MQLNPVKMVRQFLNDANRMLSISSKPSNDEFKRTLKVVLVGTLLLGALGYVISILVALIV